ncbi:MAG TPA: hypothetical protein VGE86_08555 [Thermoanaerobaculia bacterium]
MGGRRSRRLQQRIDATLARTERLGVGAFGISDETPDEIVEAFLDELEGCPLCRELEERGAPPETPGH